MTTVATMMPDAVRRNPCSRSQVTDRLSRSGGPLVGGQVDDERVGADGPPQRGAQPEPDEHDEQDRDEVHREHDGARVRREERRGEQHVDGEPGRAGRERHEQRGEHPVPCVRQDAGRRHRRHVAAEADDDRQEGAPGQPEAAHHPVGDDGGPRHVAGVLEQREQQEHQGHQGHEGEQHADPGDDAVDHQAAHRGAAQADGVDQPAAHRRDRPDTKAAEGVLQRRREGGRRLEDHPHHTEEEQRAEDRCGGEAVDAVRPGAPRHRLACSRMP